VALRLLRARREGGQCYCALYELTDPEMVGHAIEHARHMLISDDGSLPTPTEDYIYSQQAISGKTNCQSLKVINIGQLRYPHKVATE
jgi:hypothetical protein